MGTPLTWGAVPVARAGEVFREVRGVTSGDAGGVLWVWGCGDEPCATPRAPPGNGCCGGCEGGNGSDDVSSG